jgi:manganese-dependent inorganic pyrophosphatase
VDDGSIVRLRHEEDKMEVCLEQGASGMVVLTSSPVPEAVVREAERTGATVITTELHPLTAIRLIHLTPPIEQVMIPRERVVSFSSDTTVDEVERVVSQSRYRAYPVLDRQDQVIGSLSRYHLLRYSRKKLILVDHNEKKQTVDDVDAAEILEIVDHHRMGGFESDGVISITCQPVGATATIIAEKYLENGVPLDAPMAGILLGAIVSDTMNYHSPTTTDKDREIGKKLEEICGVSAAELSAGMIASSGSILNKRFIEIVFDDFKEFAINGCKVGLAQSICKSKEEYLAIRDDLGNYLEDNCKTGSYDLMIVMLTDPSGSGSYLVSAGSRSPVAEHLFPDVTREGFTEGLVSRKKQLLPAVIKALS